jgi:hypothetical protein
MTGILTFFDLELGRRRGWKYYGMVWMITGLMLGLAKFLPQIPANQYQNLLLSQIPLLAWVGIGAYVLTLRTKVKERWSFLLKSMEIMVTVVLMMAALMVFGGISLALFNTMKIVIPEAVFKLLITVGLGIGAMTAVGISYNPQLGPDKQSFNGGVYPLMALVARLFVPLTAAVLLMYLMVIPFNFWVPVNEREVLVTFNGVLMAVIALLIGATPNGPEAVKPTLGKWLRLGLRVIAILTIVITAYVLAATSYRTYMNLWTINRAAVIGWNLVNLAVLTYLTYGQFRTRENNWVEALQRSWARAMGWWALWVGALIMILPWFFW